MSDTTTIDAGKMTTEAAKRIAAIPDDELLAYAIAAAKDLQAAEIAVGNGLRQYQYRIDGNKKQLQVIQCEIKRRMASATVVAALTESEASNG